MKTIWKALITTSIAAALFVPAMAQQAGPTGGGLQNPPGAKAGAARGGAMRINRQVLEKLQPPLTKEQKGQIAKLDKKTAADTKNLRDKLKDGDRAQLRDEIKKITETYKKGLMEILTPAQKTSYQELYKQALEKAMQDRKEGKNGKGGN